MQLMILVLSLQWHTAVCDRQVHRALCAPGYVAVCKTGKAVCARRPPEERRRWR